VGVAIEVTWFSDPACPWAYSASPPLAVLRWRYGTQLDWRLVTIGLSEDAAQYESRGFTPARMARAALSFRRYGMPFATQPRERLAATGRACRAIVATRLLDPEREFEVHRALQLAWANTALILDQEDHLALVLAQVPGLDAGAIVAALDDQQVTSAYEVDRDESRSALGGATEFQGKAAEESDGRVRYTAPTLIFEHDGVRLEAGGFQPIEAYDVLIANFPGILTRQAPPESPLAALEWFAEGLTTQEVAAIMAHNNELPDRNAAEAALIDLVGEGSARRTAIGDDALWQLADAPPAAVVPPGAEAAVPAHHS
jgi:protein-disulfide isomerase-like protein with CxxC motif